ncbi:MAG: class I SAM-dependent RNA methyltransferase, partial [Alphaproteobacteria bacterium]|nr:class I SAM-dependent RNA methyltransferase [Alphaproteobacteria bacterium]
TKKKDFITYAFRDVGLNITPDPVVLIPTGTRRRASFAFIRGHLGFNAFKSHQIVEIQQCPLLREKINNALPCLRQIIRELNTTGDLFVLDTEYGLDIHIKDKTGVPKLPKLELLSSLSTNKDIVRVIYNDTPIFEKIALPATADSFMQPSFEGEQILITLMMKHIGNAKTAVDLFCGKGTFTKPLLEKGLSVTGYDNAADSVAVLGANGVVRDLFRNPLTSNELAGIDLVVLDPPRAGAKAQIEQVSQTNIPQIIMISCNPKTAANDVKTLVDAGWNIQVIIPVDQFTYSNHIEVVIVLQKSC